MVSGEDVHVVFDGDKDFEEDGNRFQRREVGITRLVEIARHSQDVLHRIVIYLGRRSEGTVVQNNQESRHK